MAVNKKRTGFWTIGYPGFWLIVCWLLALGSFSVSLVPWCQRLVYSDTPDDYLHVYLSGVEELREQTGAAFFMATITERYMKAELPDTYYHFQYLRGLGIDDQAWDFPFVKCDSASVLALLFCHCQGLELMMPICGCTDSSVLESSAEELMFDRTDDWSQMETGVMPWCEGSHEQAHFRSWRTLLTKFLSSYRDAYPSLTVDSLMKGIRRRAYYALDHPWERGNFKLTAGSCPVFVLCGLLIFWLSVRCEWRQARQVCQAYQSEGLKIIKPAWWRLLIAKSGRSFLDDYGHRADRHAKQLLFQRELVEKQRQESEALSKLRADIFDFRAAHFACMSAELAKWLRRAEDSSLGLRERQIAFERAVSLAVLETKGAAGEGDGEEYLRKLEFLVESVDTSQIDSGRLSEYHVELGRARGATKDKTYTYYLERALRIAGKLD